MSKYSDSDIKSWLEICLAKENLSEIVVENVLYSEKGDGAIGDIVFVDVKAKDRKGSLTAYNLALKSTRNYQGQYYFSRAMFVNEIYFYEDVLTAFYNFQKERGIEKPFDNIPKYYGSYTDDHRQVLAFENLSKNGYSLWDRKKPMTRNHINLIIKEYARFHAISVAMQDQKPDAFKKLLEPLERLFAEFDKGGKEIVANFFHPINEVHDLLQNDLDPNILSKWKKFGEDIQISIHPEMRNYKSMKVINHGDCWNNNFMFQTEENNEILPTKVTILDWQVAKIGSPVTDLAHFLFTCISEKDLEDFNSILNEYYANFSNYLIKLKSDPKVYSKEQFLQEWQDYSKFGIMMVCIALKVCLREQEDEVDIAKAGFKFEVRNKTLFKERIKPVVKYVVKNNLI